jgi:hypothetical protein
MSSAVYTPRLRDCQSGLATGCMGRSEFRDHHLQEVAENPIAFTVKPV